MNKKKIQPEWHKTDIYQVINKKKTRKQVQALVQKLLGPHSNSTGQQDSHQQHQFYPERLSCYLFTTSISHDFPVFPALEISSHDFKV